jgi:hypothetical protein
MTPNSNAHLSGSGNARFSAKALDRALAEMVRKLDIDRGESWAKLLGELS